MARNTLRSVSPAGNRCHFVLLDKDDSCPTDLSSMSRPNGPAYSTGELFNTLSVFAVSSVAATRLHTDCPCG